MSTLIPGSEPEPTSQIDYHAAEGLNDGPPVENPIGATVVDGGKRWREWMMVGVGLTALLAILAVMVSVFAMATGDDSAATTRAPAPTAQPAEEPAAAEQAAPTLADAKGVAFEPFERVDPALPPVPAGKVKTFEVDVYQHVTQVSKDLAPTEVWSFAVNGKRYQGTGVSGPMVVNEGDTVDFTLTNGSDKAMKVNMPHSLDFHSAEVNPGTRYKDLAPGKSIHYRFVADHPGVFMYHCATQPVLMHTGAGMVGMFVVKPKDLAPVDRELWITQQEYYLGKPGGDADMAKMAAKKPDVIAFNGYANQYQQAPIGVRKGEKVRMYVLNAGPSVWSAFHVIGTVFDRTMVEGTAGHDAQTINLAPSQGGWVEFTLDEEGTFPFVNHAFGDMVKGSLGILATPNAPKAAGHGAAPAHHEGTKDAAAATDGIDVTLGDMWVKSSAPTVKAGKVAFNVKNEGAAMHGLAITPAPAKVDGGMLDESSFLGKGADLGAGESETVTWDLEPGEYELVCHLAGHYMAGQKLPFKVE
ncbi:MAG TPA: multicopper oxidase domain-containing protein [Microbacterium sp.]|nr:multicopper oxidase domain-containing protein [Microbacterium sp.]